MVVLGYSDTLGGFVMANKHSLDAQCDKYGEDSTHEMSPGRTYGVDLVDMPITKYYCDKHYAEYMKRKDRK